MARSYLAERKKKQLKTLHGASNSENSTYYGGMALNNTGRQIFYKSDLNCGTRKRSHQKDKPALYTHIIRRQTIRTDHSEEYVYVYIACFDRKKYDASRTTETGSSN